MNLYRESDKFFKEQKLYSVLSEAVMLESKESNRLPIASRISKTWVNSW